MSVDELPPLQTGPAAWHGPETASRRHWILHLTAAQIAELEAAMSAAMRRGLNIARLAPGDFALPTLGAVLKQILHELLHGRGFVLIRGLPLDRYSSIEAATIFMGIGAHLGRARSQNAKGHVLGHVFDLGLSSTDPDVRIYQTHERQTFHTDSCDVVGLLCLRAAKTGGDSLLVSALTIYNELYANCPDLLERLFVPMAHDRRGEVPAGAAPFFMIPVFSWHANCLTVFYQRQYFDSAQRFADAPRLTPADVAALDRFDALANDPRLNMTMRLAPGDMQFVHNHNLLHDRTAFEDWSDPERRRHLLRLWLACPGARELPPAFAARYGSLEIGNRGGIVVPGAQLSAPLQPA
jgi:alpha-ketoglutarate-dependent taurine dioxygenase